MQKFRVSMKISWEPGSLVPGEYPTLIPALMSLTIDAVNAMKKRKDKTFISRMVKALTTTEYLTPRHITKRQLSTKKQENSPIVPDELASKSHVLAAPKPEELTVSEPIPLVRIEPVLPNQKLCRVHSCSQDHEISGKDYRENKGTDRYGSHQAD